MRNHSVGPAPWATLVLVALAGGTIQIFGSTQEGAGEPAAERTQVADPTQFPEIVARVNGAEIDRQELLDRVEAVKQRMNLPPGQTPMQVYRIVLSELVEFELLYQASSSHNAAATPAEVEAEIQELRAQFPTEEAFQQQLAAESITTDRLKAMLHKDLSVQKLVESQLTSQIAISDEAKRDFYAENTTAMQQPERLRLRHILSRVQEDATDEQKAAARTKIEGLRKQVEGGADFAALAREHSDDTASRTDGGEMMIGRGQTVEPFEQAAFALQPGALSPVVETRFGFHIIQAIEHTPARQVPYEEVEGRIQQFLQQQAVQEKVQAEVENLKRTATIEILL